MCDCLQSAADNEITILKIHFNVCNCIILHAGYVSLNMQSAGNYVHLLADALIPDKLVNNQLIHSCNEYV